MKNERLFLIIPAHNEEGRIERTLISYSNYFSKKVKFKELNSFEIFVVLNNCSDGTLGVVKKVGKLFNEIKYVDLKPGGKGFAIIQGFKRSVEINDDELVGFVDADMATPPEAFYDLVRNINNYDGIIASRWLNESKIITGQTILRKITSRGFNFLVRILFFISFRDTQCGAKLFKKSVIREITPRLNLTKWAFDVNLLYLCKRFKFKVKEYPTVWEDIGDSKINLTKTPMQMFFGIIRLRLIYSPFSRILVPLKFILKFGDKLVNK